MRGRYREDWRCRHVHAMRRAATRAAAKLMELRRDARRERRLGTLRHARRTRGTPGSSSAWQSTTFGTWGPEVQILSPRLLPLLYMPRRSPRAQETLEERWLLEAQTARNLEAMAAEQAGELETAIALYERNVAEGFPADLPYGRLVAIYERRGALDEAERVLRRAIEVLASTSRRSPQDRRATVQAFRNRLAMLLKRR